MVELLVRTQSHRGKMFCYEPEMVRMIGKLVPNPYWIADDCITLHVNDKFMPMRIIKKSDVAFGLNVQLPKRIPPTFWTVKGSRGDDYLVTKTEDSWTCSCRGFEFHNDCKHIRSKKADLEAHKVKRKR
jgi:SWIM zinc finger